MLKFFIYIQFYIFFMNFLLLLFFTLINFLFLQSLFFYSLPIIARFFTTLHILNCFYCTPCKTRVLGQLNFLKPSAVFYIDRRSTYKDNFIGLRAYSPYLTFVGNFVVNICFSVLAFVLINYVHIKIFLLSLFLFTCFSPAVHESNSLFVVIILFALILLLLFVYMFFYRALADKNWA